MQHTYTHGLGIGVPLVLAQMKVRELLSPNACPLRRIPYLRMCDGVSRRARVSRKQEMQATAPEKPF